MMNFSCNFRVSRSIGLFAFVFLTLAPAFAASVPLSSLQPTQVYSYPNQNASPQATSVAVIQGQSPTPAMRLATESEVSYSIPAGQTSFSGILIYRPSPVVLPEGAPTVYVPILVRMKADDKVVFEQAMDGVTPPVSFSVPLGQARRLTIVSTAPFVPGGFYLADAAFGATPPASAGIMLPTPGTGFVDCALLPRQSIAAAYFPNEDVTVRASFAGSATQAHVVLRLTPESGTAQPSESQVDVPLHAGPSGVSYGTAVWRIPSSFGPLKLEIEETVDGRSVFQREQRIAVARKNNVADLSDSEFAIHESAMGYPMLYDEFSYLWGAKWCRIFLRWPMIEYNRGQYDFSRIDALLNIYHAQNMKVLLVLGEDAPAWAGTPGPDYYDAWKRFVAAIAQHVSGKIDAWDVFNEVDIKYYSSVFGKESSADVALILSALDILGRVTPGVPRVCCSTVSNLWMYYNKRLFDSSFLPKIDIVSFHPYEVSPPEEKDGVFNYLESVEAFRNLVRSYGVTKPLWSTEANWIIGFGPGSHVPCASLPEEKQAEYVVRVNLLSASAGVKYFLHVPFGHAARPIPHTSTYAAYAQMASLFAGAGHITAQQIGEEAYQVTGSTRSGEVGALWSAAGPATVQLNGGGYRFFDMYGNPMQADPANLSISPAPIYFTLQGSAPEARLVTPPIIPAWHSYTPLRTWQCPGTSSCAKGNGMLRIQGQPSKYAHLVDSGYAVAAKPGACYKARVQLNLEKGIVQFFAVDAATYKTLDTPANVTFLPDGKPHYVELRFHASGDHFKLIVANANSGDDVSSVFTIVGDPEITSCQ